MQSHFEAKVTGGSQGKAPFKINIPAATAESQGLKRGDIVKITIEKVEK